MADHMGNDGGEMTKAEWERARQLGEEARRAGMPKTVNPFQFGYTDDYVQRAVAWDDGYAKADEERRR